MLEFDADIETIDNGIWMPYEGSKFLIAHMSNKKFQRALARNQQPYRKKLENGTLDPEINKAALCKSMAEGILLDWKDVVSKGSKTPVTYTVDNACTALMKNVEFRDFISEVAMNMANFKSEEVQDLGNA